MTKTLETLIQRAEIGRVEPRTHSQSTPAIAEDFSQAHRVGRADTVHSLSILVPLSYRNERPIFPPQFETFSKLANSETNVIFTMNDIDEPPPAFQATANVIVLLNFHSRSKAQNLFLATSHGSCAERVIVWDFNEIPTTLTLTGRAVSSDLDQGPKIFRPEKTNTLSMMCFLESGWKYLVLLPLIAAANPCSMMVLGSNFAGLRRDVSAMFDNNSLIAEDLYGSLLMLSAGRSISYTAARPVLELAPRTVATWTGQRMRWSLGLVELCFCLPQMLRSKVRIPARLLAYVVFASLIVPIATISVAVSILTNMSLAVLEIATAAWCIAKIAEASVVVWISRQQRWAFLLADCPRIPVLVVAAYPLYEIYRLSVKSVGFCAYLCGFRTVRPTGR